VAITIAITSGLGYFGSVYTQTGAAGAGQWYADETPISGQTGNTYTMEALREGKKITYRTTSPAEQSNAIHLFMPEDISGLLAEFDAARADLITLNGSNVSAWASRFGSLTASQATAGNQVPYSATGRNGKPALLPDGTAKFLNLDQLASWPSGTQEEHVFAQAYYANAAGQSWRVLLAHGSASNASRQVLKRDNTELGGVTTGVSGTDTFPGTTWINVDKIVSGWIGAAGTEVFTNGNETLARSFSINTGSNTRGYIFQFWSLNGWWNGACQDLIAYNRKLTTDERQKVEGYLAAKWDTRALLPAGHPYKSALPAPGPVATVAASGFLPTADIGMETNPDAALTISVTSGTGYFGSVYTCAPVAIGQWYANGVPLPGATASTYTMESKNEGKKIDFRAANGRRSNTIQFFTPDQVSSILAWWDASRADLLTLSGAQVSLWTSRFGTRTLSQATAGLRPLYSATGRNGLPAITADGTDDYLIIDQAPPSGANPSVVAAHAYFANVATGNWKVLITWSNAIVFRSIAKNASEFVAQGGGSGGTDNVSAVSWTNADRIAISTDLSTGKILNVNGNASISKPYALTTPNASLAYVFRSNVGDYWNGSLQDLCLFNAALSQTERERLEGYFASKWGTRAILPAGHPYKSSSPPPMGVDIVVSGYLPTAEVQAEFHLHATVALNGLLPTMASVVDTAAPGPITITVTSGTGYAGSVYERDSFAAGYWWVGNTRLDAEQGMTLTMKAEWEGRTIQFRAANGYRSNGIDLFVPAELFGLLAHFDAYQDTSITHIGGVVSQWASRWGSWTATQAVEASKPAYSATGRNSRPAITADGSNDHLVINPTGAGLPDGNEEFQIVALGYYSATAVAAYRMLIKWGGVASARRGIAKSDSNFVALIGGTAGTNTASNISWPDTDRIVSAEYQPVGARLNVSGGADIINATIFNPNDQDAAYIFRDATAYWNGSAQEILLWDRRLTEGERQKVEGYLASKWGQRAQLPGGHPYKSSNPPPNQSGNAAGVGYLPTADIQGVVPFVITGEATGYLPTAAILSVSAPAEFDGELNGYLPTAEITGQMQTRVWADVNGLLPTVEAEFALRYPVTGALNGYLPTAEIAVDFPIRATLEITGYLPVAEIGGESVYEVDIEALGLLPTAAIDAPVFQFEITAEVNGFLPTMDAVLAVTPKVTLEAEGYLPFAQMLAEFPARIMADMEGYLPTAEINAGPIIKLDIELFGLLPTAEVNVEPMQYIVMADVVGFLPVSEIGGESVYEVVVEGFGLLPTSDAEINVPQRVDVTVFALGFLPTAEVMTGTRYVVTGSAMGYLATAEILAEPGPVEVTLDLTGYLPTGAASGGGGGEPERPAAYTPSASSANSTLTVGGGPVLSYGSGLKVG
jgi:hypothetical protein